MISTPRRLAAIASATGALALAGPLTGAYAAGTTTPPPAFTFPTFTFPAFTFPTFSYPAFTFPALPAGGQPQIALAPGLTFVPPAVGPIAVHIGAIIIDGQQISPGVDVSTPGTTVPPIATAAGA
jgi:hypothetical protein